jgi:rare lipoprotein A (peptidoglycan hydrolase)
MRLLKFVCFSSVLDLSKKAAKKIEIDKEGVAKVKITYKK